MLTQHAMLERLRAVCQADERVVAATLYGSFAVGEADEFSDVECVLFFRPEALAALDREAWAAQIAPVALFFADDFGHFTAVFENLVRGEFHFDPADALPRVEAWAGSAWFPSLEAAVLVDRTGELSRRMAPLIGRPPERDTLETVRRLAANFLNLVLFGANVFERGELARALEILSGISRYLQWMARLTEGATAHWPTPSRAWEQDLSPAAVSRLAACTARLRRDELAAAYQAAWRWGVEMAEPLSARHALIWPRALVDRLADRVARLA